MAGFVTPTLPRKPTEFHYFPDLAPEIRLKIWAYALPGPRVVEVNYKRTTNRFLERTAPASTHLVHANWEARVAVFEHYSAWFGTEFHEPSIYVNPKVDIISLNFDAFRHWRLTDLELDNIRYLEINDHELYKVPIPQIARRLRIMPCLKQFIVIDPRSPFIAHPLPDIPAQLTQETLSMYFWAIGQYILGCKWEQRYRKMWRHLVAIDYAARRGNFGLPNIAIGMVGVTTDGVRRYHMVGRQENQ